MNGSTLGGLLAVGGMVTTLAGVYVGNRLNSTSERDENERQAARASQEAFKTQTDDRLKKIEVTVTTLATTRDINHVVEKVGQVESKVAGIAALMSLVDPRLKPGGLAGE